MIEDTFFESLAHYASGMAMMSFCVWAVILHRWRRNNRMTFLLFLCVCYVAVGFVKDAVFLLPERCFADMDRVEDLVSIFDLGLVPLVSAFFLEATRPGCMTRSRLLCFYLPFLSGLALYAVWPSGWVLRGVFALSVLAGLATLVVVPANVVRYNRYLSDNYSYTQNIGVGWCMGCAVAFFLVLALYEVCFYRPTWMSELAYDTALVVVWNIVCLKCRRHRVVVDMMSACPEAVAAAPEAEPADLVQSAGEAPAAEAAPPAQPDAVPTDGDAQPEQHGQQADPATPAAGADTATREFIATALERCMERERLYLDAHLSLPDLAAAVGTNKTYISTYLNGQGCTFYDFINRYRVEEACRIIDRMATHGRIPMTDVAARSGFNSISSFNRYFFKVKGVTPTAYSRRGDGGV